MLSRIFVRVQFDNKNYFLSEKKLLLSGDIKLNPGPAEFPNPLTYGGGFMCSSSTYFLEDTNAHRNVRMFVVLFLNIKGQVRIHSVPLPL